MLSTVALGTGDVGPADEYRRLSGTSMATPLISGVLALLISHRPNLPRQVSCGFAPRLPPTARSILAPTPAFCRVVSLF
eukprot:1676013-Pleurochrysis_carterae.AAC.4